MADEKEWDVVIHPDILKQMEVDPGLAEAIRQFSAAARQAMQGVETGQYEDFNEGMEAITGNRPEPIEDDMTEEELEKFEEAKAFARKRS